jgi:hypothetical protein
LKNKLKSKSIGNKMNTQPQDFSSLVRQWQIWYHLRKAIEGGFKGLLLGIAFSLGFSLVIILSGGWGLRFGLGLREFVWLLILSGLGAGSLASLMLGIWPIPNMQVLRFFDQAFHLHERTSTALENLTNQSQQEPSVITQLQLQDAIYWGKGVKPSASFFWTISRAELLVASTIALAALSLAVLGQPYFENAAQQKAITQAIESEIARLEELKSEIEANTLLSPEDQAELQRRIQGMIQKLEQADTIEEAIAVIADAEANLRDLNPPDLQKRMETLEKIGDQILQTESTQGEKNPLEDFGEALAEGDLSAAAQELGNLDVESLSSEERQALAEQLKKASDALVGTDPKLADQLSRASQALESNDSQTAQQALQDAAAQLAQSGSQVAQADAIEQATGQTSESIGRLLEAGRNTSGNSANASAQTGESTTNPAQADTQGPAPGAGEQAGGQRLSGQNDSQGSGSGAGRGSSDQAGLQGSEASDNPIEQGNGPGDGGERPFVPIDSTYRPGGSDGSEVYLPESGAPGGEVTGQTGSSDGEISPSSVPYTEIFPEYLDFYRHAIESGSIPITMRDLVRQYFANLEP